MRDKCVRERCRKFRDGRTDVHDEGGQARPSLVTDDLVQHVDKVVHERRRFTISELSLEFPQVCWTVLYEIVTKNLATTSFVPYGCQKCSLMSHRTQRMVSALTFLQRYQDEGDEFLDKIVTGDAHTFTK